METASDQTILPTSCMLGLYSKTLYAISPCLEICSRNPTTCCLKSQPIHKSKPSPDPAHCSQWEQGKKHPQWKPTICQMCEATDETLFYPGVKNHCKACLQKIRAEKRGRLAGETVTRICRRCGESFQKIPSTHVILCQECR
jgi:hypothetical protein